MPSDDEIIRRPRSSLERRLSLPVHLKALHDKEGSCSYGTELKVRRQERTLQFQGDKSSQTSDDTMPSIEKDSDYLLHLPKLRLSGPETASIQLLALESYQNQVTSAEWEAARQAFTENPNLKKLDRKMNPHLNLSHSFVRLGESIVAILRGKLPTEGLLGEGGVTQCHLGLTDSHEWIAVRIFKAELASELEIKILEEKNRLIGYFVRTLKERKPNAPTTRTPWIKGKWIGDKMVLGERLIPGTELARFLKNRRRAVNQGEMPCLPLSVVLDIYTAMAMELSWFQARRYIHRDIKPQNMILDSQMSRYGNLVVNGITFVDLTSVKFLPEGQEELICHFFGTRPYSPIEVTSVKTPSIFSFKSDIYALAKSCCFPEFEVVDTERSNFELGKVQVILTPYFNSQTDLPTQEKMVALLEAGLSPNPALRPNIEQFLAKLREIHEVVLDSAISFLESEVRSKSVSSLPAESKNTLGARITAGLTPGLRSFGTLTPQYQNVESQSEASFFKGSQKESLEVTELKEKKFSK